MRERHACRSKFLPGRLVLARSVARTAMVAHLSGASVALPGSSTTPSGTLLLLEDGGCQASWVPTFGGPPGVDDEAMASTVFDDGGGPALYVGGSFTSASNVAA